MKKKNKLKESLSLIDRMEMRMTLTEAEEFVENERYPHSDDIFDLDQIPMEILDKAWQRYHPYLLGLGHRHPLSNRLVVEGTDEQVKLENIKAIITSTFPIPEENFIIQNGHNGLYAAILVALTDDNIDIIENAMSQKGFFRSQPTDEQLLMDRKNRKWIDIRFEAETNDKL